jgi:hypothetical protein
MSFVRCLLYSNFGGFKTLFIPVLPLSDQLTDFSVHFNTLLGGQDRSDNICMKAYDYVVKT